MCPEWLTASHPVSLWIELTSKCPFDCKFCSRRAVRGDGLHMDFRLFRRILGQLEKPEVLRLNYSGESMHYPHLVDAVRLAKRSGASVELVTALATASPVVLRGLVEAGLDRLSISLHTRDESQFHALYGFSSLQKLDHRLAELLRLRQELGSERPVIDFAFVALNENLDQLEAVTRFAAACGAVDVSVHPVIRREPELVRFPAELDANDRLRPEFATRLAAAVERLRREVPEVRVQVARPSLDAPCSEHTAAAGLASCEQNPWDTMHVLSNGDVVVCEVQDRTVLGNLERESLRAVWHGERYRRFRQQYLDGEAAACSTCAWRRGSPQWQWTGQLTPKDRDSAQFLRGWHRSGDEPAMWAQRNAVLVLRAGPGQTGVSLRGLLPPGPTTLRVRHQGRQLAEWTSHSRGALEFAWSGRLPAPATDVVLSFEADRTWCPARSGAGGDLRELGFALYEAALFCPPVPLLSSHEQRFLDWLQRLDDHCAVWRERLRREPPRIPRRDPGRGLSVLIPERGTPEMLGECLEALVNALLPVRESTQVLVVSSDHDRQRYAALRARFGFVEWLTPETPLGFSGAIQAGLRQIRQPWVYLLNSDMRLHPRALAVVLAQRAPQVFSVASRIRVLHPDHRHEESNWTDLSVVDGLVEIRDVQPDEGATGISGLLYSGGGSSLYQTGVLRRFVSTAYDPFYWEDVEWGVIARRHGYENLFCADSETEHGYRATVRRFYPEEEIRRVFERNRLLFQLRNLPESASAPAALERAAASHPSTREELMRTAARVGICWQRMRSWLAPFDESCLFGTRRPLPNRMAGNGSPEPLLAG